MAAPRRTYYDDLGVPRTASDKDIERAWRKYRAEADLVTAAPDRVRESRMKAAYETLSNPAKRENYDLMLKLPRESAERSRAPFFTAVAAILVGAAGAAAYLLKPPAPPPAPAGSVGTDRIAQDASKAMARVDSMEMTGKAVPIGLAFAIDEGTVATTCRGISPLSQLTLHIPPRTVPVKVAQVDEKLGVCKLSGKGIGSWPLKLTSQDPAPGDTVYVTKMDAAGEPGLAEAKVKRVYESARGKSIELSVAVLPERQGGPVFDVYGNVVGVQLLPDSGGYGEVVRVLPEWTEKPKMAEPPAVKQPPPVEASATSEPEPRTRREIEAERRERLEKALGEALKKND